MDEDIRIVILQRGWVVVGRLVEERGDFHLHGGAVVRIWGTTRGLGELASNGPTADTVLDPVPEMQFHPLTVIATVRCEPSKWAPHIR